ncbi:uncharacterized protein [Nicotiana sylvestris]|uniref:uncharacterized protein n=1 Tax=Nicotiana sylvestris TaxID=4096 RepID=UPI00388C6E1A
MTNPPDNPRTPPPPTPSNSSTPPPPSTSPKPRLRRVKMLARKTVASDSLRKKLNEKLKASQTQNSDSKSDSKSYISATEGEGHWSFDSEKTQESPSKNVELLGSRRSGGKKNSEKEKEREGACGKEGGNGKRVVDHSPTANLHVPAICGVEQERVEESGKKSGGSNSGEAADRLVNMSTQGDEHGSSTEETLADLLKKVGASYDPKKCRTPTLNAPSVPKPSKKRKASSPTTTEFSLPKGRTTRSRVKQSESDLQKAIAESKKKKLAKEKGKVTESSEDVEVEEMEQVHQEEVQPVEVQTPKPKKPKTSSKKSSYVSKAAKPSLDKRTRSVVKGKQVKISEDEEWSGEEVEDDSEQDKLAMFGKKKILKGRLLKDLVEPRIMRLVDAFVAQG